MKTKLEQGQLKTGGQILTYEKDMTIRKKTRRLTFRNTCTPSLVGKLVLFIEF